jgi:hypothetical protein
MEIEYTPAAPQQKPAPKSEFVLIKDVTGKPIPKRGPQVLKAIHQDKNGQPVTIEFRVPYAPKTNCKHCLGRGYLGFVVEGGERKINICRKCYPVTK